MAAGHRIFPAEDWFFIDENPVTRLAFTLVSLITTFVGAPHWLTPVRRRGREPKVVFKPTKLTDLGAGLRMASPELMEMLSLHQRRLRKRMMLNLAIRVPVVGLLTLILIFLLAFGMVKLGFHGSVRLNRIEEPLAMLMIYCFFGLFALVASRLSTLLTDKKFADSLALMSWVYVTVSLTRDSTLGDPNQRRRLLRYMQDLQRSVRLLGLTHAGPTNQNRQWVQKHFGKLANYIADRERWAIAPLASTLERLRQDFWGLAPIFIRGNYGAFVWEDDAAGAEEAPNESKAGIAGQVARIVGFGLPLVVLGILLMKPAWMDSFDLNANTLALIFFSWLLLAIDGIFKLGVISGLISLVKGVKELT